MAEWTDITDARLEPGKPGRSIEGMALRDNVIAAFEGAAGAPRLQQAALPTLEASTSNVILRKDESQATTGTVADFCIGQSGIVNVYYEFRKLTGSNPAVTISLNGSVLQLSGTSSTSWDARSLNVEVSAGDYITLTATGDGEIRSIWLRATNAVAAWSVR